MLLAVRRPPHKAAVRQICPGGSYVSETLGPLIDHDAAALVHALSAGLPGPAATELHRAAGVSLHCTASRSLAEMWEERAERAVNFDAHQRLEVRTPM